MPGITGFVGKGSPNDHKAALDLMVKTMMHESFFTSGTYVDERLGIYVGWTAHKDSFADCLPIWNETRDVCLIFAGDEFTEPDEIKGLKSRGHQFDLGNASYLVHLYEELGEKFLVRLNGWFSGVLIDLRINQVTLFNDRYGVNRVYLHETAQGIYFSSEAKAILRAVPGVRQLDLRSLSEFLTCAAVLQDRSLFAGVSLLPGGSAWRFEPGKAVQKRAYFKCEEWEALPRLSAEDYYEKLKATWKRILPRYFRGKDRIGVSLTGGIDSRMILAWADCPPGSLPCYTWGGTYRDCADVSLARRIAGICKQPHQVIPLDQEFWSEFPRLAEQTVYLSDGCMDVTGTVDLFVQRKARRIAPVRITGLYGGEVLRSVVAFKHTPPKDGVYGPEFSRLTREAAATYRGELQGHKLSFVTFKQSAWYMHEKLSVERSQLTVRTPYLDNDLVAVVYQAPPELAHSQEPALRLIAEGNPAMGAVETDRGIASRWFPGATQLRHAYQQFTFKAEYAYDYGMPQSLAKLDHAFSFLHLEKLFLGRHKFHHFRVWYRDKFADYLRAVLLDPRTLGRPYLDKSGVEMMVNRHLKGDRNYTLELHKVLTSELIQRQLIEQN